MDWMLYLILFGDKMVLLERREEELLLYTCVAKRLIVFLGCTLLGQCSGQRLHNIAIVVPENNVGEVSAVHLCTRHNGALSPQKHGLFQFFRPLLPQVLLLTTFTFVS